MNKKRNKPSKEELIKQCRFYKGEEESPFPNTSYKSGLWFYEHWWVEAQTEGEMSFDFYLEDYSFRGLDDFSNDDGVPITLKALLLNRYNHGEGMFTTDEFKEWYKKWYLLS